MNGKIKNQMTDIIYQIISEGYLTKDKLINWIDIHIDENLIQN